MIIARSGSTSAKGPCFSSPARMPSLWVICKFGLWILCCWCIFTCASRSTPWFWVHPQGKWRNCTWKSNHHAKKIWNKVISYHWFFILTRGPWQAKTSAGTSYWLERKPGIIIKLVSVMVHAIVQEKRIWMSNKWLIYSEWPRSRCWLLTLLSWARTVLMLPGRSWRPRIISDLIQTFSPLMS